MIENSQPVCPKCGGAPIVRTQVGTSFGHKTHYECKCTRSHGWVDTETERPDD